MFQTPGIVPQWMQYMVLGGSLDLCAPAFHRHWVGQAGGVVLLPLGSPISPLKRPLFFTPLRTGTRHRVNSSHNYA
jgi:hypothetical protein